MKKTQNIIYIFFDEPKTCESFPLSTEIFINRTCNREKICDNIRLIGECNIEKEKLPPKNVD